MSDPSELRSARLQRRDEDCPAFRAGQRHDWRVDPNQLISGDDVVSVHVVCAICHKPETCRVRRRFREVDETNPETWRPFIEGGS